MRGDARVSQDMEKMKGQATNRFSRRQNNFFSKIDFESEREYRINFPS